jgi:hypothetical protein
MAENTTRRWMLKIVPDAAPNADGEWVDADVPCQLDSNREIYNFVPRPGYHVVQRAAPTYPRDSEPPRPQHA